MTVKQLSTPMKNIISCIVLGFVSLQLQAQLQPLREEINQIIAGKNATIGVAVMDLQNGDSLIIKGRARLPMQSVFKLHLAMAVLAQVDKGKLKLDQIIFVKKSDMKTDLYSPLRDKHPEGNLNVPLRDLLRYSVSESDNVACDLLFGLVGGPSKVQQYLRTIGIREVAVANIEAEIQKDWETQFNNWTTPRAMLLLLQKIDQRQLFSKSSQDFLWDILTNSPTGQNRIRGLLPPGTVVAHKTGTSGSKEGTMGAVNDAGIVVLPDGKRFAIVIFVANSKESMKTDEAIIAQISKAAWDYFGNK